MLFEMLWIPVTLTAAAAQTARNALQKNLTATLGTAGATFVRFLYGVPFALLFLAAVAAALGTMPPLPGIRALVWTAGGGLAQVVATGLMLVSMQRRSFAVTIATLKTEPVLVALFGFLALGDRLTYGGGLGIVIATVGVVITSLVPARDEPRRLDLTSLLLGLASGALFAISAVGFRGAILSLAGASPLLAATTILAVALTMQALALALWLMATAPEVLVATARQWRASLLAGASGAVASQFWFLGFALTTAANVRTLALVEVVFAQLVSGRMLRETVHRREAFGMALIMLGVAILLLAG